MRKDEKGRDLYPEVCSVDDFVETLREHCDWFTAVPDSMFKPILPRLGADCRFASRENHAVAMAFGAKVGGANPCVLMQNSGLGLSLDALLGLFTLYGQGLLLVVSNRGELDWEEPQHQDWGDLTDGLLAQLPVEIVDFQEEGLAGVSRAADLAFDRDRIAVLLLHRGNLDEQG